MSDLHFLSVTEESQQKLEKVSEKFIQQGLLEARKKSWEAFQHIREQIRVGMTEKQGREIAVETLKKLGSQKNLHQPYVRFGPGTVLTFYDGLQSDYLLQSGDPVYLDLGPIWHFDGLDYEGDIGDTFVIGKNEIAEHCARTARKLWQEGFQLWKEEKASGEKIYALLKRRAQEENYILLENIEGHRVSDFPHAQYAKERLAKVPFNPGTCLWILEFQLIHPTLKIGAFYEDLLV
jgi:hypothetical protein